MKNTRLEDVLRRWRDDYQINHKITSDYRLGQSLFNTLDINAPKLANVIRDSQADCFHNDANVPKVLQMVMDLMEKAELQ